MTSKKIITVAFSSDDRGCLMLGITLYSLLYYAHPKTKYRIFILEDKISDMNKEKILSLKKDFDCEFHFIETSDYLSRYFQREFSQWPKSTYSRILLARLLPLESRVIYVDIDTLVLNDLSELYELDMRGKTLGGVYEPEDFHIQPWSQRLSIPKEYGYINAGVILFDLDKMREENSDEKIIKYISDHESELIYPDQDAINAVMYDKILPIHPKWDWHYVLNRKLKAQRKKSIKNRWGQIGLKELLEAAHHPSIVHFCGPQKPISPNYFSYNSLYRKIWLMSPWKNEPYLPGKKFKILYKRLIHKPRDIFYKFQVAFLLSRERHKSGAKENI